MKKYAIIVVQVVSCFLPRSFILASGGNNFFRNVALLTCLDPFCYHSITSTTNTCFPIQCREARKLKKQKLMVCMHPFFQNGAICKAFRRICLTHILAPTLGLLLHQHTCSCLWNLSFLMCQFLTTH